MGTRVLDMRDLKIHCFCLRVRVDKYVGHTAIKRATMISQFYPVASLFSGVRDNPPVFTETGMANLSVPPCMLMAVVYHKVSMVLFKFPKLMGAVFLHLPGGSVGSSKVHLSKYLSM